MKKECVLYDRECVDCGECMRCDLNPLKICDNCGKCIDIESDYNAVKIDKIVLDGDEYGEDSMRSDDFKN